MGRSSIIYVMGLALISGLALNNITRNNTTFLDLYSSYYGSSQARTIAVSSANVGISYLLNYSAFPSNFALGFFGGHDSIIYIQNTPKPLWVTMKSFSWTDNLDKAGHPFRDTVEGVFKHIQFAKFGWFTESETEGYIDPIGNKGPYYGSNDWKATGDSIYGLAHTNGRFNLDGTPYFDQKVTCGLAPNLGPSANPIFNGGIEYPVLQKRPNTSTLQTSLTSAATTGGSLFDERWSMNDVRLTFMNSQVHVQVPLNGSVQDTTLATSTLAPNGVIVVLSGDLHLKGTYAGAMTVAAFSGTGAAANKGNVWIDGDILAGTNPVGNTSSADMIGIVAQRMAYITQDPTRTSSSELTIQGVIYCQNGELAAEQFWNIPPSGRVNLFGGVTQTTAGSLGMLNPGPPAVLQNGFWYSIRNDPRFMTTQPPYFPCSESYELVSWWEN
jgi:hypothetical protein